MSKPKENKVYSLTKIAQGKTWDEAEVKDHKNKEKFNYFREKYLNEVKDPLVTTCDKCDDDYDIDLEDGICQYCLDVIEDSKRGQL